METVTLLGFAGICLGGYFAIMNPLANTAVFIGLTSDDKKETKRVIARQSILLTFAIIVLVSIAGNYLFKIFDITLPHCV